MCTGSTVKWEENILLTVIGFPAASINKKFTPNICEKLCESIT